jgi:hypothetical protein
LFFIATLTKTLLAQITLENTPAARTKLVLAGITGFVATAGFTVEFGTSVTLLSRITVLAIGVGAAIAVLQSNTATWSSTIEKLAPCTFVGRNSCNIQD